MSQEYWLQKKTIGGWSIVTYYTELEQARKNYNSCLQNGMSGYSWRLCKVEAVEVSMLEEIVEVEAPVLIMNTPNGALKTKPKSISGWSDFKSQPVQDAPKPAWGSQPALNGWKSTSIDPKPALIINQEPSSPSTHSFYADSEKPKHGGAGKVCMINHVLKQRTKVDADVVDGMIAQGWIKGGPRTQFE